MEDLQAKYPQYSRAINQVETNVIKLASQSIVDEGEKFEEALLAVMSQRVQEYMMVKLGEVKDDQLKQILDTQDFKNILYDTLQDFSQFYGEEIAKNSNDFAKKGTELLIKKLTTEGQRNQNKAIQEAVYEAVEDLNSTIFTTQMSKIKQLMTIAIMETQAFMDDLELQAPESFDQN